MSQTDTLPRSSAPTASARAIERVVVTGLSFGIGVADGQLAAVLADANVLDLGQPRSDLVQVVGMLDDEERPGHDTGIHWVEVVCVSSSGESNAGAKGRIRLPDGRTELVTLDARS